GSVDGEPARAGDAQAPAAPVEHGGCAVGVERCDGQRSAGEPQGRAGGAPGLELPGDDRASRRDAEGAGAARTEGGAADEDIPVDGEGGGARDVVAAVPAGVGADQDVSVAAAGPDGDGAGAVVEKGDAVLADGQAGGGGDGEGSAGRQRVS